MRIPRLIAVLLAVAGSAAVLAACGAAPVQTTVPSNVVQLMATPMGRALAKYGYTPVANLYDNKTNKVDGAIFVACGHSKKSTTAVDLTKCSTNLHNQSTLSHPNVYVVNNRVTQLEGPHDGKMDNRNYYVTVPAPYQQFYKLSAAQRRKLLGIMPQVSALIGDPANGNMGTKVLLSVGEVTAWVSR